MCVNYGRCDTQELIKYNLILKHLSFLAIHRSENEDDIEMPTLKSPFGSSFRTFDATDYSNIGIVIYLIVSLGAAVYFFN